MSARMIRLALLFVAVYCSRVAICQSDGTGGNQSKPPLPEYIQEFFLADAVRCQERGELQITSGVDSRKQVGTSTWLKMEYGITDRLQLGFDLPYGMTEEENSEGSAAWSTASLGLEYQIIRSDSPFALSAGMAFGVPLKSRGKVEFEPMILAAKTLRRLQIHASFLTDIAERKPSFQYNLASVYTNLRRWFPTLEFNGRRLSGKDAFYLTPGLYRRFEHRLEVGIGIPSGLGGTADRVGIVGKLNWEIGGDHESKVSASKGSTTSASRMETRQQHDAWR